ncbi:hypothetical protein, partial [Salmonella sp. s36468]|uniref:hypothetical protein n=1 Tax=Salmonella sp. s36468 TaxID=3159641 RepID=UPI00397F5B93
STKMSPLRFIVGVLAALCAVGAVPLDVSKDSTGQVEHGLRGARDLMELTCNTVACPNNFTPILEANTTMCADSGCTTGLCCEELCISYACPDGFTQISSAATKVCAVTGCTTGSCCEAFCSYFPCPDTPPVEDADTIKCPKAEGCTEELCCEP